VEFYRHHTAVHLLSSLQSCTPACRLPLTRSFIGVALNLQHCVRVTALTSAMPSHVSEPALWGASMGLAWLLSCL
jgi:hypothetical protein